MELHNTGLQTLSASRSCEFTTLLLISLGAYAQTRDSFSPSFNEN